MNFKEDNPESQEGLSGEPSPSEILSQMVDKLGELLHDHPNKNGNITINYYNSVGQRIDSVTTQNFSSDKWFKTSYHTPVENTQRPAPEAVVRAIEKTAHTKTSVTQTRKRLYKKCFGEAGTGEQWDEFIESL